MTSYLGKLNTDYNFGMVKEGEMIGLLERLFGCPLKKTTRYVVFDYEGENISIELKTRRNKANKYPTTMIGMGKVNEGLKRIRNNPNHSIYFVFCFTDSIQYFQLTEDNLDKCNIGLGGRNDRFNEEINEYLYIPIEELNIIN